MDDQYIVLQALIPKQGTWLSEIKLCVHDSTAEITEGVGTPPVQGVHVAGNGNESLCFP